MKPVITTASVDPNLKALVNRANAMIAARKFDEAIRILEGGPRATAAHAYVLNMIGHCHLEAGRREEALRAFDASVRKAPKFPEVHNNRGAALRQLGRLDQAAAAIEQALRLRPHYAVAHFNQAGVLSAAGRLAEAVAAYDLAIRHQGVFPQAYLQRGRARQGLGQHALALADFDSAIAQRRDLVEAEAARATMLLALGRPDEAIAAANLALAKLPGSEEALAAKGLALFARQRPAEALEIFDALAERAPDNPQPQLYRASALRELRRFEDALSAVDRALAAAPRDGTARIERAKPLAELGRTDEALAELQAALDFGEKPEEVEPILATTLNEAGRNAEALPVFDRAIARDPANRRLRYNHGMALLGAGDLARGFAEYENRMAEPDFSGRKFDGLAPRWAGETIGDGRLLIYAEQGLGDSIQFARYLPWVATRSDAVTFLCHPSLHDLFRRAFGEIDIVETLDGAATFRRQASLLSLPHIAGTTADTVPPAPYLRADADRAAMWAGRLGAEGFRVGICWQGAAKNRRDRLRSIPLAGFEALGRVPGVRLISLQAIDGLDQLDALPAGMTVERLGAPFEAGARGFDETAAVIASLDLIVSVNSAVCHLAGGLGAPVFVPIRLQAEWRWVSGMETTPWYGSMRLFRQTAAGDWPGVFARIATELAPLAASRRP